MRVRREGFGLLFYRSKEGKLTFVESGDLFEVVRGSDGLSRLAVDAADGGLRQKAQHACQVLREKGLIGEAEIGVY